jgi:hypothetical protein
MNLERRVVDFISDHEKQIRSKAAALCMDWQDYRQEIALFILERGHRYDPQRGSLAAFVFGHVDKRLSSRKSDALYHAQSIDGDSSHNISARYAVESLIVEDGCPSNRAIDQAVQGTVPGAANLLAIADTVSGMSAREIARKSKRTKRRVNQVLQKMRDEARTQFALNFGCGEA